MKVSASLSLTVVGLLFTLAAELVQALLPQMNGPNLDRNKLFHHMEQHIPRDTFVRGERSPSSAEHEVFIAVRQNNLPELKKTILERATPGHDLYQKWLTFHEIGTLVVNEEAFGKIKSWLEENGVSITWVAPYKEYITATASIGTWERMLKAEFYQHKDLTMLKYATNITVFHRAKEYSIPLELKESIDCVFHTVQTPPRFDIRFGKNSFEAEMSGKKSSFRNDYTVSTDPVSASKGDDHIERRKNIDAEQTGEDVDVAFLNSLYRVNSNIGSSRISQSVFQTNNEYFRPADLNKFQTTYGLTVQSATTANGHSTSSVCDGDEISCGEGNLDIQYIMGMAQKSTSIFWWIPSSDGDPFVTWIKEVVHEEFPPQSNSISWGELEVLVSSSVVKSWETEAMKLAGRGVTIAVASGDSGGPNFYQSCLCPTVVIWTVLTFFS
jgi:subtilase family serine protease